MFFLFLQGKEESREKITELRNEIIRKDTELNICNSELGETKTQLKLQLK